MLMASNCTNGVEAIDCRTPVLDGVLDNLADVAKTKLSPLIPSEIKEILEFYLNILTFLVTSVAGVIANVINITAYWRQGLKDSITLGFFSLSMSDLAVVTAPIMTAFCYAAKLLLPNFNVDFPSVHYVSSGWIRNMFYSLSSSLTAFLAIERCCCVVLPFKVKLIFSRRRTAGIISGLFLLHVACFVPIFSTHRLGWRPRLSANSTIVTHILGVYFLPHRNVIEGFNSTFMGIVLPTISQGIVTVCVSILIHGLRKSSRFRQNLTAHQCTGQALSDNGKLEIGFQEEVADAKINSGEGHTPGHLSSRDARLIKTMIFLVIILSVSNVPFLMMNYARRLVPDLNVRGAYRNTFSVSYSIVYILGTLNATANIFVYYKTSTKFREVVLNMAPCRSKPRGCLK